jgi:2-keto-4-pentenoate hydratase/2-oxohepta-3-ene-1,7-dioic acid hydratase in catechol pathway
VAQRRAPSRTRNFDNRTVVRIVSYSTGDGPRAGALVDDRVVGIGSSVRELLTLGGLEEAAADLNAGAGHLLAEVELLPPVPDPGKIVCLGLNYGAHAAEAGLEPPESPTFFAKFRNALVGTGARVELPSASDKVDYEAEVAFVIGRRAKEVPEADALGHVAGYMLLNDLSARDLQFATPQWMPGKVFDGSAPCGPWLATPDEVAHDAIEFSLTLNGEEMQSASTDDLVFGIPAIVAHLSSLMTLEPGDVISTGTPSGVGSTRDPRVWLQPGDEVVIGSPALGELRTTIA